MESELSGNQHQLLRAFDQLAGGNHTTAVTASAAVQVTSSSGAGLCGVSGAVILGVWGWGYAGCWI
jgi:hypothetical protein